MLCYTPISPIVLVDVCIAVPTVNLLVVAIFHLSFGLLSASGHAFSGELFTVNSRHADPSLTALYAPENGRVKRHFCFLLNANG